MEDHGTVVGTHNKAANLEQQVTVFDNLIRSIHLVGRNLGVEYERIFVGMKVKNVQADEIGCVITAAPYIHLARHAVPDGNARALEDMPLREWKDRVHDSFQSVTLAA